MKTLRLAVAVAIFAVSGAAFAGTDTPNPDVQPGYFARVSAYVTSLKPVAAFNALTTTKKAGVVVAAGAAVAAAAYAVYYFTKPAPADADEEAAE